MASFFRVALLATAAFLFMFNDNDMLAEAIIRRDGVPDTAYLRDAADFPGIVAVNNYFDNCKSGHNGCKLVQRGTGLLHGKSVKGKKRSTWNVSCGGTVIGRRHIISARHCFCADDNDGVFGYTAGFTVWVKGKPYKVKRTMVPKSCGWSCRLTGHPNVCDLAIMEVDKDIKGVKPFKIYDAKRFGSELHKNIEIYGWGVPGKAGQEDTAICEMGALDKKFRKGENTVLSLGDTESVYGRHPSHVLKFMMRGGSNPKLCKLYPFSKFAGLSRCNPSGDKSLPYSQPLKLEAITSSGDSGAPAFIRVKGELYLAGIDSAGDTSGATNVNVCGYGAIDEFTRISKFHRFIKCVLGNGGKCKDSRTMPIRAPGENFAPFWHKDYTHLIGKNTSSSSAQCRSQMMNFWWNSYDGFVATMCNTPGSEGIKQVEQVRRMQKMVQKKKVVPSSVAWDVRSNRLHYYSGPGSYGWPVNGDAANMIKMRKIHAISSSKKRRKHGKVKKKHIHKKKHSWVHSFSVGKSKKRVKKKHIRKKKKKHSRIHSFSIGKKKKKKLAVMPSTKVNQQRVALKPKESHDDAATIKSTIDKIINQGTNNALKVWKSMEAKHANSKKTNTAIKTAVDSSIDSAFAKDFKLDFQNVEAQFLQGLQDGNTSEQERQEGLYPKVQMPLKLKMLKAHYDAEISRLSAMLKRSL